MKLLPVELIQNHGHCFHSKLLAVFLPGCSLSYKLYETINKLHIFNAFAVTSSSFFGFLVTTYTKHLVKLL